MQLLVHQVELYIVHQVVVVEHGQDKGLHKVLYNRVVELLVQQLTQLLQGLIQVVVQEVEIDHPVVQDKVEVEL